MPCSTSSLGFGFGTGSLPLLPQLASFLPLSLSLLSGTTLRFFTHALGSPFGTARIFLCLLLCFSLLLSFAAAF
jgi:hypothetical protein